jgi:hypothetical protein
VTALEQRLRAILTGDDPITDDVEALTHDTAIVDELSHRRRALYRLVFGAAAGVVLVVALAAIAQRGNDPAPGGVTPATVPVAPTTTLVRPTTTASLPVAPPPDTVAQPRPGKEFTVTADRVEFGEGLVGGGLARADGRTYVLAGRYETEEDLLFIPEDAVVAAFDGAGTELWRTELDGSPSNTTTARQIVAVAGDVWVWQPNGGLCRIDGSDGRIVGQIDVENFDSMIGAFDSLWVLTRIIDTDDSEDRHPVELIRVDPDLSTTAIELVPDDMGVPGEGPRVAAVGPGGIWVPMGLVGVAVIDPETLEVTVTSGAEIGHDVERVAVDGDVVYVASSDRVSAVVDGEVAGSTPIGELGLAYLGHVDGVFGMATFDAPARLAVLVATDPMLAEPRRASDSLAGAIDVAGEAWARTLTNRRNDFDLRRVQLRPATGTPAATETTADPPAATPGGQVWLGPVRSPSDMVQQMAVDPGAIILTWLDPFDASTDWVDIELVQLAPDGQASWSIRLAAKPPLTTDLEPGMIVSYGLVFDTNGDGEADYVVGIDNDAPERGDFRVWVTDLASGETDEQIGPPYGYPVEFAHPDEHLPTDGGTPGVERTVYFTFLGESTPANLDPETARFYAWASVTSAGEVVAWDYAPDTGWIE